MDTMLTLKQWQDQYFTFAKKVQEPVVHFTGRMADTVARFVQPRPAFMAEMPKSHDVVDNGLKFRKRLVDEQAQFVRQMMKAMEPVTMKLEAPHPTPTKPVATATKAPTRRPAARRVVKAA